MTQDEADQILHASSMHDIGKIAIPDRVLLKEGPLDPAEWEVMKSHTTVGAQLLAGSRSPVVRMAEVIARTHHEKWDGTGYPEGLKGEEIPLDRPPGRRLRRLRRPRLRPAVQDGLADRDGARRDRAHLRHAPRPGARRALHRAAPGPQSGGLMRRRLGVVAAGLVAAAGRAWSAHATGVLDRVEGQTQDARFALRGAQPAPDVAVVAIDAESITELEPVADPPHLARPARSTPCARPGRAGSPTTSSSPSRAATSERTSRSTTPSPARPAPSSPPPRSTTAGRTNVLGGDDVLRSARRAPPTRARPVDIGAVVRRVHHRIDKLETFAVAAASRPPARQSPRSTARSSTTTARPARSRRTGSATSSRAGSTPRSCAGGSSSSAPRRRRCRTCTPSPPRTTSSCPGPRSRPTRSRPCCAACRCARRRAGSTCSPRWLLAFAVPLAALRLRARYAIAVGRRRARRLARRRAARVRERDGAHGRPAPPRPRRRRGRRARPRRAAQRPRAPARALPVRPLRARAGRRGAARPRGRLGGHRAACGRTRASCSATCAASRRSPSPPSRSSSSTCSTSLPRRDERGDPRPPRHRRLLPRRRDHGRVRLAGRAPRPRDAGARRRRGAARRAPAAPERLAGRARPRAVQARRRRQQRAR